MLTKKKKQVFALTNLGVIVLIILAALGTASTAQAQSAVGKPVQTRTSIATEPPVPATTPEPTFVATANTAQDALKAVFEQYVKVVPPAEGNQWGLLETHTQDAWAYVTAQQSNTKTGEATEAYAVLLAGKDSVAGWYALAPVISDHDAYQKLLFSFPSFLIDDNTKVFIASANPPQPTKEQVNAAQQTAFFTGYRLPFLAGHAGFVRRASEANHINQIDFNIDNGTTGALVVAAKAGQVVYVKQNSNTKCNEAPPDPCWKKANAIVVKVSNNEYDWYLHIQPNSAFVDLNSFVDAGTTLARQGCNGWCTGIHLHFHVSSTPATNGFADGGTNPDDLAWSLDIQTVDFVEKAWANLAAGQTLYSQNATDPSVVAIPSAFGNSMMTFVQDGNNRLRALTIDGNPNQWQDLGGVLTAAPDAVYATNFTDIYVRGLGGVLWYRRYQNGSWADYISINNPPGGATSAPSAVSMSPGRVDVFVRGGNYALWQKTYVNGSWGTWTSLGGWLTTGPDAASRAAGLLDVFCAGALNTPWKASFANGSWSWQSFDGTFDSNPGATSAMDSKVDVFVRGTTQHLYIKLTIMVSSPLKQGNEQERE